MMGIIKPCPLCGNGNLHTYVGPGSYWIVCKRCGIAISNKTEEAVIAEWNQGFPHLDKPEEKNSSKMPEAVVDFIRRRFMARQ